MADIITGMIKRYSADDRFTMEPDPAGKIIRLRFTDESWFEMEKKEAEKNIRVSFATSNRTVNEDIEHAILDSKDPIDDFIYDGMEEAGEEEEHKVEQGSRVCSRRRAQTPRAAGRMKGIETGRLDCVLWHSIARKWS